METFWFIAITFMFTMYVILDGFDLGAGMIHFWVGKTEVERRTVLNAIGPFWDGNEVWLIAAGGTLYFAFPKLYAASFSGFYLPFIIVLWLLIFRALGIELRHHIHHSVWRIIWDRSFWLGSWLLVIFLGAALGNLIRGVSLNDQGYFFTPLWTTFQPTPNPGVLDWFTVLFSAVAVSTLMVHGANFLALKTDGIIQQRARNIARIGWYGVTVTSLIAVVVTSVIRPTFWDNFSRYPWGWGLGAMSLIAWGAMWWVRRQQRDERAFFASAAFIAGMVAVTAFAKYPVLLYDMEQPQRQLTIFNSASGAYSLKAGMGWWLPGMILVGIYFVYLFYSFRGKITAPPEDTGY